MQKIHLTIGAVPCLDNTGIPLSWCEIPTEMVLVLPNLHCGAASTMQCPQDHELQKQYLDLLQMKEELEESCKKKDQLLRDAQRALAEEQDKRETAEREKQLLEEKCTQLRQQLNVLEIYCKESMTQMKEELRRREKHEKEQDERIRRLEAKMKDLTEKKQNTENYCTSKTTANDKKENNLEPSWWSKICELIEELYLLIAKFFSCG
ncbi:guanylate-binding protein 7-like isoform X1 [Ursus americanus]|uniref:guanylate-binding protein 7-like isoform X1 n=1 Tax=Ursus americanus TaxID=9643 RepID=UPI001E67AF36|nr:guanylate-binding protein 7-like isoform X1 [Ursus americanus]